MSEEELDKQLLILFMFSCFCESRCDAAELAAGAAGTQLKVNSGLKGGGGGEGTFAVEATSGKFGYTLPELAWSL